jgi:hypothetical protein
LFRQQRRCAIDRLCLRRQVDPVTAGTRDKQQPGLVERASGHADAAAAQPGDVGDGDPAGTITEPMLLEKGAN